MSSSVLRRLAVAVATVSLLCGLPAVVAADVVNTSGVPVPPLPKFKKGDVRAYATQIAEHVDRADRGWLDAYSKSTITIINARGEKTVSKVRQMILEGSGGNKSLIRYMSPANVRGVGALTHEHHKSTDDSWLYLPASRRVRRISGANRTASFQGTEFTYEDLSRNVPSRYKWRFIANKTVAGHPVYQLEAIPSYRDSGYSKLHFYMNRKHWRPERIEYFDKAGRLLKVMSFSKYKLHHGRYWRPRRMAMHNKQTQKKSIIEVSVQFLNIKLYKKKDGSARKGLTAASFTRRALESK